MCKGGGDVEPGCVGVDNVVESVILVLSKLCIKHQVGHGVIRVTTEVVQDVLGSRVERLPCVVLVSFEFMGINEVIAEFEDDVFKAADFGSTWLNVEGELFKSLDSHKSVVGSEDRIEDGALLNITPHGCPIKHVL